MEELTKIVTLSIVVFDPVFEQTISGYMASRACK
jgi:hypothetical protein